MRVVLRGSARGLFYRFGEAEDTMYINHYLPTSRLTREKPKSSVDLLLRTSFSGYDSRRPTPPKSHTRADPWPRKKPPYTIHTHEDSLGAA